MSDLHRDTLLPASLPDGRDLVADGRRLGESITAGCSALCEAHGVRSEVAYRRKMREQGRLMTCMNIGLATWSQTARALEQIHAESERRGFRIDRYQLNLDRRMGLPPSLWQAAPAETGPMLVTAEDWRGTAGTVPIQPHLGDMMIGSPMSVDNAMKAIEAGVSYIGNLSQYAWKYPMWRGDDVAQVAETVKALGVMAARATDDVVVHSYLDDGFGAQFSDYCSYIGWSLIEHHIVDGTIGARLASAYGGLTHDPLVKMAMILALEAQKPQGSLAPFYHGNTTAYGRCIDRNFALLSTDVLYVMLAQIRSDSGAPTLPIPVTEALRIPSAEEIVQAHTVARGIAERAPELVDLVDWSRVEALRDRLLEGGRRFADNVLQGLEEMGLDLEDPMQLLLALRRMGGAAIERRFGVGEVPAAAQQPYQPLIPTDTHRDLMTQLEATRSRVLSRGTRAPTGLSVILGSTDVHEYAMFLVADALRALGVEPVMAGTGVDPHEFAALAEEHAASVLLVSTHNGMALTYARALRAALAERGLSPQVAMGGVLNEDMDDAETPTELDAELRQLGVRTCRHASDVLDIVTDR